METKESILNDQVGNTLKTEAAEQLFKTTPVIGTPFNIVEREGKHFIVFGKYKISTDRDTHEECEDMVYNRDYELLLNLMLAAVNTMAEKAEQIENEKQ